MFDFCQLKISLEPSSSLQICYNSGKDLSFRRSTMLFQENNYPEKYLDMDLRTLIHQMSENVSLQHMINTASAIMDIPLLMLNNYHHCIAYSNDIYLPDNTILQAITNNSELTPLLRQSFDASFSIPILKVPDICIV